MTRVFLLLLTALICAPAAFAQSSDKDYSYYEFYVGYAHMRAYNDADHFDKGGNATFNGNRVNFANERTGYNGFTAEFNQNVHRNIGIVTSFRLALDSPCASLPRTIMPAFSMGESASGAPPAAEAP